MLHTYGSRRHQIIVASTSVLAAAAGVATPSPVIVHPPRALARRIAPHVTVTRSAEVSGSPFRPPPPIFFAVPPRFSIVRTHQRAYAPQVITTAKARIPDLVRPTALIVQVPRFSRRAPRPALVVSSRIRQLMAVPPTTSIVVRRNPARRPAGAIVVHSEFPPNPVRPPPPVIVPVRPPITVVRQFWTSRQPILVVGTKGRTPTSHARSRWWSGSRSVAG